MTKLDELARVAELAQALGPETYLGPWLRDALPYLRDCLQSDFLPDSALNMHNQAAMARGEAMREAFEIREAARNDAAMHREQGRKEAAALIAAAQNEADRIKGNAWQAIRRAMQPLET